MLLFILEFENAKITVYRGPGFYTTFGRWALDSQGVFYNPHTFRKYCPPPTRRILPWEEMIGYNFALGATRPCYAIYIFVQN